MKIFIETGELCSYPYSGIPVYNLKLIKTLLKFDETIKMYSAYATVRKPLMDNIRKVLLKNNISLSLSQVFLPGRLAGKSSFLSSLFTYPRLSEVDLFHAVSNMPPLWLNIRNKPLIITMHDLASLNFHGENYTVHSGIKDIKSVKAFADRAEYILSVSRFTKSEIVHFLGIDPDKIIVTPLGIQDFPEQADDDCLKQYGLSKDQYILAVSTLSPRKNYLSLIDAFEKLKEKFSEAKLVIVGSPGWRYEDILKRIDANKDIIWVRGIDNAGLKWLYQNARGFFMISNYEGFGIPVLEAMTCGCPVCYATGSSMDEIAGDCGVKVHPQKLDEIVDAMWELWSNETLRDQLREAGLRRSGDFTWEKCAEKTLEVYRKCV